MRVSVRALLENRIGISIGRNEGLASRSARLGIKLINPDEYCFQSGDHVCVFKVQIPDEMFSYMKESIEAFFDKRGTLPAPYFRHGIFCGYNENIPYFVSHTEKGILKAKLNSFGCGFKYWWIIHHHYRRFNRDAVVNRAIQYLKGEKQIGQYHFSSNCSEDFAYLIINGRKNSSRLNYIKARLFAAYVDLPYAEDLRNIVIKIK